MKKGWKIVLAILCAFVIAAGSFIAAVQYLNTRYAAALSAREEDSPVQAKAAEVQEIIETYFIDDYDEDTLADGAASGMVDATGDEWSYYLSADEVAAYEESMANAYVGVGITITEDAEAGGMRVEEVAAGGPAEEAGIRVGDLLLAVEGEDVLPLGIDGTRNLVRGEEGTHVNMHFSRNGSEYDVSVERRSIETPVVTGELLDGSIGYVKIDNFDERSAAETIAFVKDLIGQGAEALLFDVRFNPGGYADELVKVLDYLLPEGDLFRSVDYAGREEVDTSDASCVELPMAVLVNEDSYSAAEFFAAALQEYEWATIVGSQTYGKGNFQTAFYLSDGSMVNLSIGKYYTPGGKSLSETGVTPDVVVDLDDEQYALLYYNALEQADDPQFQAAIDTLTQKIS
ncbi:MAG: S41 family peptidase [Clostridia bacterium]|nr:MAG: S41 family peptidase [Clostridia bacterium]